MTFTSNTSINSDRISIIYDGECPFCKNYIALTKLRENVTAIELINARDDHQLVDLIISQGYNLDEGMIAIIDGNIYHGHESIHQIALLTKESSLFNKLTDFLFGKKNVAQIIYPTLRLGRNCTLSLLRRSKIHSSNRIDN